MQAAMAPREARPIEYALHICERRMQTDPQLPEYLRADCSRCSALCCVAPSFDKAQGFGFDKAAHTRCALLGDDFACSIHGDLIARGFAGCASFDCYGAGQRVTQQMFGDVSWRVDRKIAKRIFEAYSRMRTLHELLAMLFVVKSRTSNPNIAAEVRNRTRKVERVCRLDSAEFDRVEVGEIRLEVMMFLRSINALTSKEPKASRVTSHR